MLSFTLLAILLLVCSTGAQSPTVNVTVTDLGTLGGRDSSYANAMNNLGQVVGWSWTSTLVSSSNTSDFRAFLWQNGTMTDLGVLPGDDDGSDALAINNVGQAVGWSSRSDGRLHAFLWQNGAMTDLGGLGARDSYVFPSAINDLGQVVGFMAASNDEQDTGHAFLWQNGTMTDLGTLGGAFSQAFAINNVGQVVGYAPMVCW